MILARRWRLEGVVCVDLVGRGFGERIPLGQPVAEIDVLAANRAEGPRAKVVGHVELGPTDGTTDPHAMSLAISEASTRAVAVVEPASRPPATIRPTAAPRRRISPFSANRKVV